MARISKVVGAAGLSALALAAPAQADEQGYLDYVNSHNYWPKTWADRLPSVELQSGYYLCGQLHAGVPLEDLRRSMSDRYWVLIDAAQHELCPDTLEAGSAAPTPAPADPSAPPAA